MKTPLVFNWPTGIAKPGAVSNSLLSVIDLAPTLLEVAGITPGPTFQGKSFAKLLKEPQQEFRTYVFAEHNWHDYEAYERMVRTKSFLYLVNERPQFSQPGPADSNRSPSFRELQRVRDAGQLTAAQNDVFMAPRPREELFNCIEDPQQLVNIASLPAYQEVLSDLRLVLQQWQQATKDNVPENLTGDWYDRETGEGIPKEKQVRGEMPGSKSGATRVKNQDVTLF
jgi:arylsulfatase A-like enzyme